MTTLHLIRTASGAFVPATEEDADAAKRFKVGETVRMELRAMRNGNFHRKYFSLLKVAFDMWEETLPAQQYHGRDVLPEFDRFRRDVIIMAGFFRPVWSVRKSDDVHVTDEMVAAAITAAKGHAADALMWRSGAWRAGIGAAIRAAMLIWLRANPSGSLRVEAESIAWSKMTEERFEKLYSKTIDVILSKILPNRGLSEQSLRGWACRVLEYA